MDINLYDLQENLINNYNELIEYLNSKIEETDDENIVIAHHEVDKILTDIHNSIAFVGSLIDPETGKSFLCGKGVIIKSLDYI